MNVIDFLKQATELGVSDLFIVAGRPLSCKKDGRIMTFGEDRVMPAQTDSARSISWPPDGTSAIS